MPTEAECEYLINKDKVRFRSYESYIKSFEWYLDQYNEFVHDTLTPERKDQWREIVERTEKQLKRFYIKKKLILKRM